MLCMKRINECAIDEALNAAEANMKYESGADYDFTITRSLNPAARPAWKMFA